MVSNFPEKFLKNYSLLLLGIFWIFCETINLIFHDYLLHHQSSILLLPSWKHWLGTTPLGQDTLLYLIASFAESFRFSLLCLSISVVLGSFIGSLCGFLEDSLIDKVFLRLMDVIGSLPYFYTMLIVARFISNNWFSLAISFSLLGAWLPFAWHSREQTLSFVQKDFIEWLKSIGANPFYIVSKTILPINISMLKPLIYTRFNYLFLELTMLDFLGISPDPFNHVSLGQLVLWGTSHWEYWWLWLPVVIVLSWLTKQVSRCSLNSQLN